jgi:FtsZ-interacting cell division protein ZipA
MQMWFWIVIAIAAVVAVLVVLWTGIRSGRSRRLKQQFGSEYDRVAADAPTKREAEAELLDRRRRHDEFDIRPLDPEQRDRYRAHWQAIQAEFVDDPATSVAQADSLIQTVMRERGYPVDDFDTRAADLSVDHPDVVENYRAGHGIAVAHDRGKADTEDLRKALRHYRALFVELLDVREPEEAHR